MLIEGLDLTARHLVRIRHEGRPLASFHFRFPKGEPAQCLYLNELYLTWQLWGAERASCRCRASDAT